ncbi:MAG: calcium/sodium antiporter [Coraliomargaritaceae bacterium]
MTDLSVWLLTVLVLIGLISLCLGGEVLTRGAVGLAIGLRIDPLVVGLTVVSIATSMPEFMSSLLAAESNPGMALGNIFGSNLANTGLILGVAALLSPLRIQLRLIAREVPVLLFITLLFGVLAWSGGIGFIEGWVLLGLVLLYLVYVVYEARKEDTEAKRQLAEGAPLAGEPSLLRALIAVLLGALFLAFGADLLVQSGAELAVRIGVDDAFIGLTVIAVGTSLPELAASISAVRAGQGDLCAGNIIGSNLFNLLLIGGGVGVLSGISVDSGILQFEYFSLLLLSFFLFWFFKTGHTVSRREGASLLLLYFAIVGVTAYKQFIF